jgi:hypothetical protein
MQGTAWVGLFRRIPVELHDCLIVKTTTGTDVVLQRLIRLDRDFMVALGRPTGSTDQPKVVIIPYDQLTYLYFGKKLTDEEIQGAIGKPGVSVAKVEPTEVAPAAAETGAAEVVDFPHDPAAAAAPEPEAVDGDNTGPKVAPPPSKSILLARLRQRLAGEIAKQSGS